MSCESEDTFFSTVHPPEHYAAALTAVQLFLEQLGCAGRRVVLVTSGGTTVPLERKMVRFLDNFSAGTRGAISAEYDGCIGGESVLILEMVSAKGLCRDFSSSPVQLATICSALPTC